MILRAQETPNGHPDGASGRGGSHRSGDRRTLLLSVLWVSGLAVHLPGPLFAQDPPTLTLQEAYARAKKGGPELRVLAERVFEAEANVQRAWALLKPHWSANFTYSHVAPAPPELSFPEPLNFQQPDISQNCVEGGDAVACLDALLGELQRVANAPPRQIDLARQDTWLFNTRIAWNLLNGRAVPILWGAYETVALEQERADARGQELLLMVARAYYAAVGTQQAIAAAERAVQQAEAQELLIASKTELGERTGPAREAARIAAEQARLDLARTRNAHAQSLLALALVTHSEDRPDVVAPPKLLAPAQALPELQQMAQINRLDLRASQRAITVAEHAKDAVWWQMVPVIGVFGSFRSSNVAGLNGQREQWAVGVNATVDLYDGGLRYAELQSAESKIRSASLATEALLARIKNDVERAWLRIQQAELNILRAEGAQRLAQQNLALTQAQLDVGTIRPMDLKEATDAVLDAELTVIRTQLDYSLAVLELQQATGTFAP